MFLPDLVVRSRRVVTPTGTRPAAIHVRRGRIIGVLDIDDVSPGCPVDDAGDRIVMPGLVDLSVHVGRGDTTWAESFETTTRAAAAGGVTSILTMPFDGVGPVTSVAALRFRRSAAEGHCFVDVGFWGGVVPGNEAELAAMFDAGVPGFHCVVGAGSHEGYHAVSADELRRAMPALRRLAAPLVAYAELPEPIAAPAGRQRTWMDRIPGVTRRARRYGSYLDSRPKALENAAIAILLELCQEFRVPTHVANLSSSDPLTPIFHARAAGLPFGAGTCPHYLVFAAEEIPDGALEYKAAPPIRERANRELLWAALAGGIIQSVASDHHAGAGADAKRGADFLDGDSGIASIVFSLPAVWTAARARGYSIEQVARWMCQAPAQLAGASRKGSLDVGFDADLVVFDPGGGFTAGAAKPDGWERTPYDDRRLAGMVERTYVRGQCVYERGRDFPPARGRFLLPRQYTGV